MEKNRRNETRKDHEFRKGRKTKGADKKKDAYVHAAIEFCEVAEEIADNKRLDFRVLLALSLRFIAEGPNEVSTALQKSQMVNDSEVTRIIARLDEDGEDEDEDGEDEDEDEDDEDEDGEDDCEDDEEEDE